MVNKKKPVRKSKGYTKKDLEAVREKLVKQKADILEELMSLKGQSLQSTKDSSGDLSGYALHMADQATDLYDREFLLELAEGERDILIAIDEAINRIDEGTYGKCETCGCDIPRQRLKAMPEAKNCIPCQEKHEKSSR